MLCGQVGDWRNLGGGGGGGEGVGGCALQDAASVAQGGVPEPGDGYRGAGGLTGLEGAGDQGS